MTRSFAGISQKRGPDATYDVVVVGAGVGGLICANLLVCAGLRVLLVENHSVVGGYCSTFYRRGFTFDAASHFYPLLGNLSSISGKLLADLGMDTVWRKMDPVDQFHFPDGSSYAVPADYDRYLADLKAQFPEERESLDKFFGLVRKLYLLGILHYFHELDVPRVKPYLDLTVRDAIDEYFKSPKLKLLLTADCPHWGSPPSRTSFVFDSMLRLSYFEGNYYPEGGSQAFADQLAHLFESRGGHILLKSKARRILMKNGKAVGIEIETGPQKSRYVATVNASQIISNADMRQTIENMLQPGDLPSEYIDNIRALRPSFPCFLSHIGVKDISREQLCQIHGYYWRDWDSDRVGIDSFKCKIFVPTLYEPHLAPPGQHVVIVQKVIELDYAVMPDWQAHKQQVEKYILGHLEQVMPGFSEKIVVCLSASAETSHRFTLNYQGAMLGWEMSPDQLGRHRPSVQSPIENLKFVGQWTRPGGGITPVIVSAMRVAQLITKTRRFDEYLLPDNTIAADSAAGALGELASNDNSRPAAKLIDLPEGAFV